MPYIRIYANPPHDGDCIYRYTQFKWGSRGLSRTVPPGWAPIIEEGGWGLYYIGYANVVLSVTVRIPGYFTHIQQQPEGTILTATVVHFTTYAA